MDAAIRLVAGLGNPGKTYEATRHNAGFLVADELGRRMAADFSLYPKWQARIAKAGEIMLIKPMTFMNLSGEALRKCCDFFKIAAAEVLVVVDDLALPVGALRLRRGGSSGGHNGLESVIAHLGTDAIPRLRLGIGSPSFSTHHHVLSRFLPEEEEPVARTVARAADAIQWILANGIESAMNRFNVTSNQKENEKTL